MHRLAMFMLLLGLAFLPAQAGDAPGGKVLFLCTGNIFRSAFAEHYFNFLAARNLKLDPADPRRKKTLWRAESRGLDLQQLSPSQRAARMSKFAVDRLDQLQAGLPRLAGNLPDHTPTPLAVADLEGADRVIAMHEPSHKPMLQRFVVQHQAQFKDPKAPNALLARVVYWNIEDVIPGAAVSVPRQAERALDAVQKAVDQLFESL
jgi:protein-tyrosine phosphatase